MKTFNRFPKVRPPLPGEFARIYTAYYKENREGRSPASSLSQKMESWLHRRVAGDVRADRSPKTILEIGAGTLNHLPYEPDVGPYDIVEPREDLYAGSPWLGRIRNIYADISAIPPAQTYDRITSIAAFEHICDLPDVVARAGTLLKPGGRLRVSIPSEGTVLWTLGWKLTTGLEFRLRYGLDYGLLMRYEHVNSASEIEEVLRHFFDDVEVAVFGLSKRLSLYRFYECARPQTGKCHEHLDPGRA
jgi:SAM-dependent methyltransferase